MKIKNRKCLPQTDCCPPSEDPLLNLPKRGTELELELSRLAKAIAHPARIRILQLLTDKGGCICGKIVEDVGLAQATVSQHLRVLKNAGLISGEVDGPKVCYGLDPSGLRRLKILVSAL